MRVYGFLFVSFKTSSLFVVVREQIPVPQIPLSFFLPRENYLSAQKNKIISVNIELYIPFDKDESFCKSCIHEFRLFLENYSTKFLHREYLLSNDLRLTYYGRNLINATKKGANLSDQEIDEDYRDIFNMASTVSEAPFTRLKEYRDLN